MALGDTIEKITSATGIKKVVDVVSAATDVDCGCPKRKEALNNPNLLINKIFYKNGVSNERGSLRNGQHSNL
jgi:hypothetical protein